MLAGAMNVAPSAGLPMDTLGAAFGVPPPPLDGTPHASSSSTRLYPFSAAVTLRRIFVVVTAANVSRRQTRLLFVTAVPGMVVQAVPVQYWTSNARSPHIVKVIVSVGST